MIHETNLRDSLESLRYALEEELARNHANSLVADTSQRVKGSPFTSFFSSSLCK
jgi:hypothetical protein